ncbi:MAG: zinc-dependent alcohol dehydrogenase [Kaistia sp. SCN 65-12]|nr:MAG: zinc-dependent alcohol dehydrogenase [Kaistia sp. SCN 65-12]
MAKTMKAAVVTAFKKPLVIREVPVPEVGANQILMKVEASGVCHTDLHAAHGDWPVKPSPPFIPGHEGVGFVAAVGRDVKGVKEGDRIGVPWLYTACGHCPHCRTGWETLCHEQQNTGYSVNGGFADYVVADPTYVGKLPASLDFGPAAPVLCAGVTVYKGLKETEARPGEWVAVSGIGGLGHMAVQYAKAMGMHCAAIDVHPEKLDLARKLGADMVINAREEDPGPALHKAMGGVHGVLVTAVSPKAFAQAQAMLRRRGTMVLVGLPPGDFPLPIFDTVLNRITVRGSIVGTRQDLAECLEFAGEGKVKPHFSWEPLDAINDIFDRMQQEKIDGRIVMRL